MRARGTTAMCAGGSSEIRRASCGTGQHHQRAGIGERVIGAGDADIDGRAELLQLLAVGDAGDARRAAR